MKHAKKLVSLLLTLVMVLAMSVTAFAEEDKHTYELYQIFTGDYADGVLSNVKWGKNGKGGSQDEAVSDTILDELTELNSQTDSQKLDAIKKYVDLTGAMDVEPTKNTDGSVTYNNLTPGYYLVKDEDGSIEGNDIYTTYVVRVTDGSLTFKRKGDVPTVDKEIVEGTQGKDVNEASIGDTINFKITGTLPSNIADYKEYTYIFTDTLSKGLTYTDNTIKVCIVNGATEKDVTKYFYQGIGTYDENNGTTIMVGISDLKALGNLEEVTINNNSKIVVTYSATLNKNAKIAGEGNDNKVKLSYSNDPNNSGEGTTAPPPENPGEPTEPKGQTPESRTVTYTTGLTILKNDSANKVLTGAEFTLTGNGVNIVLVATDEFVEDANGNYWKLKDGTYTTTEPNTSGGDEDNSDFYESTTQKYEKTTTTVSKGASQSETNVVGAVGNDGRVTFSGLGAGTYTITETKTPSGYNTISPITFTLSFNDTDKMFVSDNDSVNVGADNMLDTTIINQSGSTLPSTGGMGTTIFYVLGAILVVGAGVLLVVRRRMNMEK